MIKRAKHSRACSLCRRKKIRCDASENPDLRCSKCAMYGVECHFEYGPDCRLTQVPVADRTEPIQLNAPEGRATRSGYAEFLEKRLRAVEDVLRKLGPGEATDGLDDEPVSQSRGAATTRSAPGPVDAPGVTSYPAIRPPRLLHDFDDISDLDSSDDEDSEGPWTAVGDGSRYHGKSSSDYLVRTLAEFKAGKVHRPLAGSESSTPRDNGQTVRPTKPLSRDTTSSRPLCEELPPPDLLDKLVDAYFQEFNIYYPLLHRPTFDQSIREDLHVRDDGFCAVVLLVCANGSRWVEDDRLQRNRGHPPGMHWFERAGCVTSGFLEKPRLYDLQALVLTVAYMNGTDSPYGTWTVIGVGIRMAQDVGVHRKKTYSSTPTIQEELWRRAFWILVAMDRLTSFGMGRPCAIHDEDFDLDPMTECDDEYWTPADPALAFKQPPGRPSRITFANCLMRQLRILAFASRTIYTTNKSKLLFGFMGSKWKQSIVAELDSALNKWMDSVPAHLRWDTNIKDPIFFNQSAALYSSYYQAQICIHRHFLPSRRSPSLASTPTLTICTSAARSCVAVLYAQHQRTGPPKCVLCSMLLPLSIAASMLVIALSASKANGRDREVEGIADDIGKCFEMLLSMEPYHQGVGKFRACLHAILIAERPMSSSRTATSSASSDEPSYLGADHLGDLVLAMMNNLSLSPQADLEDVGPTWGHPAEAPFYGPKPQLPDESPEARVQHTSAHASNAVQALAVPPLSASSGITTDSAPALYPAASERPAFELPFSPPPSLDMQELWSIDFAPFFAEHAHSGSALPDPSPFAMFSAGQGEWVPFVGYDRSDGL